MGFHPKDKPIRYQFSTECPRCRDKEVQCEVVVWLMVEPCGLWEIDDIECADCHDRNHDGDFEGFYDAIHAATKELYGTEDDELFVRAVEDQWIEYGDMKYHELKDEGLI